MERTTAIVATYLILGTLTLSLSILGCEQKKAGGDQADASQPDAAKVEKPAEPPPPEPPKFVAEKRGKDQREMVKVEAGEFLRGSIQGVGREEERPQKRLKLSEFWIDRDEVTVADFALCVKAGGCKDGTYRSEKPKKGSTKPAGCNYEIEGRDKHPMNCVSWDGARAYCAWAGKRLPTEAEWEKAARGSEGASYPWGEDKASCAKACMVDGTKFGCGQRTTCPIRSREAGMAASGTYDMAGNVYEWVQDTYDKNYYSTAPLENPVNSAKGAEHPVRGGSYASDEGGVRAAQRSAFPANERTSFVGFRCAGDP